MYPDEKIMCHHTAFEKSCFDMVTKCKCRKWVRVQGKDPQTNADIDSYDCRDHVDHMLTIAVLQAQRQTTASVDAVRGEMQQSADQGIVDAIGMLNLRVDATAPKLIGG